LQDYCPPETDPRKRFGTPAQAPSAQENIVK